MISLNQVTSLTDLSAVLPKLVALHEKLEGKWEVNLSQDEFLEELIKNFQRNSWYFGQSDEQGELIYFAAIRHTSETEGFFWLFYMNAEYRNLTNQTVDLLKLFMRNQGLQTVYLSTTRLTSSYDRWLEKHGATKFSMTYQLKLNS